MSRMRDRGRRVLEKVRSGQHPAAADAGELARLRNRVDELEREVQETRRLHRRLAELTDVVEELLVPMAQHDEQRVQDFLDAHSPAL